MRRLHKTGVVVTLPIAALTIAAVAYAATLGVSSSSVSANQAAISGCMTGTASHTYPVPTDAGTGFVVANVVVGNIDASAGHCLAGMKVYLNLTDGLSTIVATGTATAIAGTGTQSVTVPLTFVSGKTLKDVGGVNIAIL